MSLCLCIYSDLLVPGIRSTVSVALLLLDFIFLEHFDAWSFGDQDRSINWAFLTISPLAYMASWECALVRFYEEHRLSGSFLSTSVAQG